LSAGQIEGVDTSTAAFVGVPGRGSPSVPVEVTSLVDYEREFGSADGELGRAVGLFFENEGRRAFVIRAEGGLSAGLGLLEDVRFALLAIPDAAGLDPQEAAELFVQAAELCERRGIFLVVDPPAALALSDIPGWITALGSPRAAAVYVPRLRLRDRTETAASGAVLGVYARTDRDRGVWRAPAGMHVTGAVDATLALTDEAVGDANAASINVIRRLQGIVVWGARTLSSDPEWRYVNVRRFALFLERSISEGTRWAVFEPNGEQLWTEVRRRVEAFMLTLFQQGAFEATRAEDAYFVRCDRTTMTHDDIDNGRLVVVIGFAPIRPAEFVVVRVG
jgi:phage tail sheath protein FI